jgi:uncharacterized protein (DUF433 family)
MVEHISKTPGVCGGKACIAGHRIRVMDIVIAYEMRGMTPEEVVQQYPGITLADVYAALAYYFDNLEEIQGDFRKDEEWAKFAEAHYPSLIKDRALARSCGSAKHEEPGGVSVAGAALCSHQK